MVHCQNYENTYKKSAPITHHFKQQSNYSTIILHIIPTVFTCFMNSSQLLNSSQKNWNTCRKVKILQFTVQFATIKKKNIYKINNVVAIAPKCSFKFALNVLFFYYVLQQIF
eukprot:TRINITY_DN3072_c0_g1_i8.p8 TRINITY_DN3072_c0_g1~~TRINITY_DN3072_c0_g1_i8.p8  ORF type:complete len:112 (+),score=1.74 TRINITY_DN3072_c0_g1_i8:3167-3502(+)